MTDTDHHIDRMSRAARTSLFDGVCDPDLLIGLVLSNLMSPALWEFRDKINKNIDGQSREHQHGIMEEIAHYVNNHFFHLTPHDVGDTWGLIEIDAEAMGDRYEPVHYAIDLMVRHIDVRIAEQGYGEQVALRPYVDQGKFPEYIYTTLDIVHANRRILKRKKRKPYGITCCVDEAILISSLACVLDGVSADDLVFIGSPEHYTAFIRHHGQMFWFNGKKEFFDAESWAREVRTNAGGNAQLAFDNRMVTIDRAITPHGTFLFHDGLNTMAPDRWSSIREDLVQFFGVDLRQIAAACDAEIEWRTYPLATTSLAELDRAQSSDEAKTILEELAAANPGASLEAAFYAFRRLDVRHPEAYVVAALREHRAREAAADLKSVDDAVAIVRAIEGNESIFGDRDRLALPDEVLLLKTGGDRDKALLLYTLLHHAGIGDTAPELLFTDVDSYVRTGDDLISLTLLAACAATDGKTVFHHGM